MTGTEWRERIERHQLRKLVTVRPVRHTDLDDLISQSGQGDRTHTADAYDDATHCIDIMEMITRIVKRTMQDIVIFEEMVRDQELVEFKCETNP